jgi:ubiquinone/menaquinone biosynthesis C-methylase UbiE
MKDGCQKFYDRNARTFDAEQDKFAFVRLPEKKIVRETLDALLRPGQMVLEIGAGTGRFTMLIAPRVRHVTAVDISANMLAELAEKMEKERLGNIDLIHGDFLQTNFQEHFDLIVGFSAIEYIKGEDALFEKMAALLKPGGQLVLTTPHHTFIRWWGRLGNYFRQKIFMTAYSKKKITLLLERNGLKIVDMHTLCLKTFFSEGVLLFIHAAK